MLRLKLEPLLDFKNNLFEYMYLSFVIETVHLHRGPCTPLLVPGRMCKVRSLEIKRPVVILLVSKQTVCLNSVTMKQLRCGISGIQYIQHIVRNVFFQLFQVSHLILLVRDG